MPNKSRDQRLEEIEETQAALRENIAESKRLIDKSQDLIEQHRKDLKSDAKS